MHSRILIAHDDPQILLRLYLAVSHNKMITEVCDNAVHIPVIIKQMKISVLLVHNKLPGWSTELAETVRKLGASIILLDDEDHPAPEDLIKLTDLKKSWPLHNNEVALAIREAFKLQKQRKKKK